MPHKPASVKLVVKFWLNLWPVFHVVVFSIRSPRDWRLFIRLGQRNYRVI